MVFRNDLHMKIKSWQKWIRLNGAGTLIEGFWN